MDHRAFGVSMMASMALVGAASAALSPNVRCAGCDGMCRACVNAEEMALVSNDFSNASPDSTMRLHVQLGRRHAGVGACALLTSAPRMPAIARTELTPLDYLSPARFAVKKQKQKQEDCYAAGNCADDKPYYAIECQRDDTECLQRKRRLASQEIKRFTVEPTSSPILLLAVSALGFQWGAAALRIGAGMLKKRSGETGGDEGT